MKKDLNLIWLDLEMTGLDPNQDRIIEIATVVTDSHLEVLAEGPVLAVRQDESAIAAMDDWNTKQHTKSGLIERVRTDSVEELEAERLTLEFLQQYVVSGKSPMCGNSICQDRRFLSRYMPKLENFFHYRNLDVSTVKELARRWKPDLLKGFKKKTKHLALSDIMDSIDELKYYRQCFIKIDASL